MTVKGLTTPYRVGCEDLFVLCRCEGLARSLLLDWYLGSRKTEGNTYATLLHHPFLFKGKPMQCSRGSKKDSWRRCRAGLRKSQHTKYPSQNPYLPHYIICHLPLVFLSPTSPLPFYSPSLFCSPSSFLFAPRSFRRYV